MALAPTTTPMSGILAPRTTSFVAKPNVLAVVPASRLPAYGLRACVLGAGGKVVKMKANAARGGSGDGFSDKGDDGEDAEMVVKMGASGGGSGDGFSDKGDEGEDAEMVVKMGASGGGSGDGFNDKGDDAEMVVYYYDGFNYKDGGFNYKDAAGHERFEKDISKHLIEKLAKETTSMVRGVHPFSKDWERHLNQLAAMASQGEDGPNGALLSTLLLGTQNAIRQNIGPEEMEIDFMEGVLLQHTERTRLVIRDYLSDEALESRVKAKDARVKAMIARAADKGNTMKAGEGRGDPEKGTTEKDGEVRGDTDKGNA